MSSELLFSKIEQALTNAPEHPKTAELILRDTLAIDRTRLANQRTFLAFERTGIYFIITALGIFHLDEADKITWMAWIFTVLGVASMITGVFNYFIMRRKIIKIYKLNNVRLN